MRNFFIIHGSNGNSKENWFPWMKDQLESRGYECIVPDFPCKDGHQVSKWYEEFEKYKEKVTDETVFIAHLRGVSFVLNLLTDFDYKIDSLYMVGGFVEWLWEEEEGNTFFSRPFNYTKIRTQCKRFVNYQSDNDPWVPKEHGKSINNLLNSEYKLIKGAGHFNTQSGYTKFEVLLNDVVGG